MKGCIYLYKCSTEPNYASGWTNAELGKICYGPGANQRAIALHEKPIGYATVYDKRMTIKANSRRTYTNIMCR